MLSEVLSAFIMHMLRIIFLANAANITFGWIHLSPWRLKYLYFSLIFRTKTVESAKAEGEKIRLIGGAEARAVEAVGRAEAERMRMKASAYKQYGDAAILSLVLEALPQVSLTIMATS